MNYSLYKSFFKLAVRNSMKNKGPISLNILGLGLALSFSIIIYMLTAYNLEFDSVYENTDEIYRLHSIRQSHNDERRYELAPQAIIHYLNENSSNTSEVVSFDYNNIIVKDGFDFIEESGASVSKNFLEIFDLPLKYGSKARLKGENVAFISEEIAEKYFKDRLPVDLNMTIYLNDKYKTEVTIAGVFEKPPLNSSFQFDILINQDFANSVANVQPNRWKSSRTMGVYLRSENPDAVLKDLEQALDLNNTQNESWEVKRFELIPFVDSRIADHIVDYSETNMRVRPEVLIIFGFMAVLILLVACFNFTNTGIALMAGRIKEIGIRRTVGSQSRQIFIQFFFEILVISGFALIVAVALSNYVSDLFFGLFGAKFLLKDISIIRFIPFLVLFLLLVTSISGLLPSLYALKFNTVSIMQSKYKLKGIGWSHKLLTSGQFIFSIIALIAGLSFARNANYMQNFDYGFNAHDVIIFDVSNESAAEKLSFELSRQSFTQDVVKTRNHIDASSSSSTLKLDTSEASIRKYAVGSGYFDLMEIEIKEGRDFLKESAADLENSVIVNQSFASVYLNNPPYVGQSIRLSDGNRTVVGVTSDVINTVYSDYEKISPEIFIPASDSSTRRVLAKVSGARPEINEKAKMIWSDLFETPYTGTWQEDLTSFYPVRDSKNIKLIFLYLAGLSCFLSLMGIFSLAEMNVSRKFKEISIRKVLGATYWQIISGINRSFFAILSISLVLGVLLGFLVSDLMISTVYNFYQYLNLIESLTLGVIVVVVAMFFVSLAVLKKSRLNPTKGLRTE